VPDDTTLAAQRALHGQVGAALDQAQVGRVCRRGAGEIAGLLHKRLLGPDHLGELVAEPLARVDRVELHVPEGVARHLLPAGLQLGHDGRHAGALTDEQVHVVHSVHDRLQALRLRRKIDRHLGNEDAVDFQVGAGEPEAGDEFLAVEELAVGRGRRRGEPAAVAAHDLVDDEHARVGIVLGHDVAEIARPLFGRRPGAERLADGIDVVVDRLGQADDGESVVVLREEGGEVGRGGVGVVAADGVQHVHAVLHQLVGRDPLRVLPLADESALQAVFHIGQLHPAVADGAAAVAVQDAGCGPFSRADLVAFAQQEALVAGTVGDELDIRRELGVALDQPADGGAEAGGQAPGSEEGDFLGTRGQVHGDKRSPP